MAKKKKQSNIRSFFVVRSDRGFLRKGSEWPDWTDNTLYMKLYAKHGSAQGIITKYRSKWRDVEHVDIVEFQLKYIGSIDEIAEKELLSEADNRNS